MELLHINLMHMSGEGQPIAQEEYQEESHEAFPSPDFSVCASLEDLRELVAETGDVRGRLKIYRSTEILESISEVRAARARGDEDKALELLRTITSTGNLRATVDRLTKVTE